MMEYEELILLPVELRHLKFEIVELFLINIPKLRMASRRSYRFDVIVSDRIIVHHLATWVLKLDILNSH